MKRPTATGKQDAILPAPPQVAVTNVTDDSCTLTYFIDISCSDWLIAVRHADAGARLPPNRREATLLPLFALLLVLPITEEGRILVRDLIDRHKKFNRSSLKFLDGDKWSMKDQVLLAGQIMEQGLPRERGRPETTIYEESEIENRLAVAKADYKALRKAFPRVPIREVRKRAAELNMVSEEELADVLDGKRTATRTRRKKLKESLQALAAAQRERQPDWEERPGYAAFNAALSVSRKALEWAG